MTKQYEEKEAVYNIQMRDGRFLDQIEADSDDEARELFEQSCTTLNAILAHQEWTSQGQIVRNLSTNEMTKYVVCVRARNTDREVRHITNIKQYYVRSLDSFCTIPTDEE